MVRDTVAVETRARFAISRMSIARLHSICDEARILARQTLSRAPAKGDQAGQSRVHAAESKKVILWCGLGSCPLSLMHKTIIAFLILVGVSSTATAAAPPWTAKQANDWYAHQPWLVGSNFIPSTAINELEMWQADTFDLPTIDRELGWAQTLGMNTMRLFVLLDSVWDPYPKLGRQRDPKPHVHNSGWVQAPGAEMLKDEPRWNRELKPYVVGVIAHFRDDKRVLMWDLMNEPDNENGSYKAQELPNKAEVALRLLREEWTWARTAKPSQPLTSGVWRGDWSSDDKLSEMASLQLQNSDVITFHSYDPPDEMKSRVASLRRYGRPVVCTEYMARPRGSTFTAILPLLKGEKVGAYNWGFVNGKSQTIYPWDSWDKTYTGEPPVWFHDIFRQNGNPYDAKEVTLIRQLTR